MASHRGLQVLLVALLLTLAGCAEQTAKTAEAPTSPAPPPRPATTPSQQPATATAPAPSSPAVAPPSAPPSAPAPAPTGTPPQEFVEQPALKDVFFEPGRAEIGRQGTVLMKSNAGWLIEHSATIVLIEGYTDWKGTPDANMAMGERRALAARDFLVKAGVSETRLQIVSHGSDRPVCPQKTEACAARNRRVHFLVKSQ
jgi:peptidoglycan-associated lipoprotein